jgi:uncharacterized integral membrane protein
MRLYTPTSTAPTHVPEFVPDTFPDSVGEQPSVAVPNTDRAREAVEAANGNEAVEAANGNETRAEYVHRQVLRGRLHGYAIAIVALIAVLIALAASNTARVKVNWLFGSSHVSLVWLVLVTAIVAWLLGLLASARFNWRTRAPRPERRPRS